MKPTPEEIASEIKTLTELKPKVKRYSAFSDDHHAAIDEQIEALKGHFDDTTEEYWELPDNVRFAAEEAYNWSQVGGTRPSHDWKSLVK